MATEEGITFLERTSFTWAQLQDLLERHMKAITGGEITASMKEGQICGGNGFHRSMTPHERASASESNQGRS